MSVDATRKDFWQSTARSSISERCKSIFNQELLSDVKFVVRDSQGGSESKKIPAHKFVLAVSSPVFFAMFYGKLAESKDSVEIHDCEYETLLECFRFIYTDEANLKHDNVMQLMYLAKKYMLPSLADRCSACLEKNLDASNVFHVLPDAQKYDEKDLLDRCWKLIEKQTEEAVKSDGFVTIERSVLEELVEKDLLNIKEVELFKAVDSWAENECERQGIVVEGSTKRRILGERIVKGIRFPLMEEKDFAHVVLDSNILNQRETYDLMKYFNSVLKTPVRFSRAKRDGKLKIFCRFRTVTNGWDYFPDSSNSLCLTADKDIKLHAVRFFGSEKNEYSVSLTVKNGGDVLFLIEKEAFMSEVVQSEIGDYQGFAVVLEPPILLEANVVYFFIAKITGPPSLYGQGCLSRREHSGVRFVFRNVHNSSTLIEKGQFSEFLFSLVPES